MLTTAAVAHRLGVKPETVYAYVSRGVLHRVPAVDGRTSLFDPEEVEALARRGRPRRSTRPVALELTIETALTGIHGHRLVYRGRRATALARTATFEQVAELLWTGALPEDPPAWPATPLDLPDVGAADRIRLAVALAGAADGARGDLAPDAVVRAARGLLATVVAALPVRGTGATPHLDLGRGPVADTTAGHLWVRLARQPPGPGWLVALNAALVLLADHEIASSTLAARVAASTRADPYAVVGAGLGPLAGSLHGAASGAVHRAFAAAEAGVPPGAPGRGPGAGHPLYPDGDPRATTLLALVRAAAPGTRRLGVVDQVATAAPTGAAPDVDFALGALTYVAGMPADAGEVVFTVARIAGWLAHALEEYGAAPLRFRPRAVYVGDLGAGGDPDLSGG